MKDKIYYDGPNKALMINGKAYIVGFERKTLKGHPGNPVFIEKDKEYDKRIYRIAKYLAEKAPKITMQEMIAEPLKEMTPRELARLEKSIKRKKPVRRESGCISLNVGGQVIVLAQ